MKPIAVTHQQMNLILMAVEHGFREHERGKNLQGALSSVFDLYRVKPTPDLEPLDPMRGVEFPFAENH